MAQTGTAEHPPSTLILIPGIWSHLSRRRRIQLGCLLFVMLASGAAELVSLGAVLPFLAVLSDPDGLWQQPLMQVLASRVGFTQASDLLLPATLAFAAAAVVAASIRLANLWLNGSLAAAVGSDLSCDVYRRTLNKPYELHLQLNSSDVITGTTTNIAKTVESITSLLQLITASVVVVGLIIGLLLIDAAVALGAIVLFGSLYFLLGVKSRRELRRNSQKIAVAASQQIKVVQEGLGAIRDVLLNGNQHIYIDIYREADRPRWQLQAKNLFLGRFPRYAVEALGLVGIALIGGLLMLQQGDGKDIIPLLGAFALGFQRLLPALQQIYFSWSILKGNSENILEVLNALSQPQSPFVSCDDSFAFRHNIRLEGVFYGYGSGLPNVIKGLDMEIRLGERIGLIGTTGSGKSTTVDLLMGLLAPTSGRLMVDGLDLHDPEHPERLVAWRAAIAHVPQSIYLSDSSIAENIAFGVPRQQIDMERVKQAAKQAQIADFIEGNPDGYHSFVGERGIRLSGGQRQRIGIARALYKQAHVLVLDEATSALDTKTEENVMAAIEALSQSLTVIMIAHRLSTLESCDRVIRLVDGLVLADGRSSAVIHVN